MKIGNKPPSKFLFFISFLYLFFMIILPLLAVINSVITHGYKQVFSAFSDPHLLFSLKLTIIISLIVALINMFTGTLIAWVLIRCDFPGKGVINALVDVPFAVPTVVAGLMILTVYGPEWVLFEFLKNARIEVVFAKPGIILALCFVTFPFVIRSVQPVLMKAEKAQQEAAETLGASKFYIFRRIILPPIVPSVLMGGVLSLARALGEFGSVIVVAGNIPMKTQLAPVYIYSQIESGNIEGALSLSLVLLGFSFIVLCISKILEKSLPITGMM